MKNNFTNHLKKNLLTILISCFSLIADPVYKLPETITFAEKNIPLEKFDVKNRIEKVFNNLVHDRRGYMQSLINKQNIHFPIANNILKQYGLDNDFSFIIPVESDFNPRAISKSKASGPWQLMPATARMYGLRVDGQVDERNLLYRSTQASAEHLAHLMYLFENDVFLTLAAFNNGEGNVKSMLKSQNAKDFWDCISNSETDLYVPKIVAYKIILSNPEKFGFKTSVLNNYPVYYPYTISLGAKDLPYKEICEMLNISFREFYNANPHIKNKSYKIESSILKFTALEIFIPEGSEKHLSAMLRDNGYLTSDNITLLDSSFQQSILETYVVENSDNIESIAFRYGISWKKIAEFNDLEIIKMSSGAETAKIYPGQKLVINR
ncbi:MAG: transglycosylase SLT domain-containing protein [Candidatus Delongbacteria bacterium]|nr:transglycosylase SLT domain-containing protein [Candidatus Delongbacteria bacterium]